MRKLLFLVCLFGSCFLIAFEANAQTSDSYIQTAIKLKAEKKYEEALDYCRRAINIDPNNAWAYNVRASVYLDLQLYDKAIADFNTALKLVPNYTNAQLYRAVAYYYKQDYQKALLDYSAVVKEEPKNTYAILGRGNCYFSLNDYDKALADYSLCIRIDPKYSYAWNGRGITYNAKGDYSKAIIEFSEAIRLSPNFAAAWGNRGLAYLNIQDYTKAINDYTQSIYLDATQAYVWNGRGYAYANTGEYQKAISDLKIALDVDPKYERAYINIISPLVRTQQFNTAKSYYDQYRVKGLVTYIDENERWKFYKNYITAVTQSIPAGNYALALNQLDQALIEYGKEIKDDNKAGYIDILAIKGYVLEKLNHNAEAKDIYAQALVINNNQPDVKEALQRLEQKDVLVSRGDNKAPAIELISPEPKRGLTVVSAKEKTQIVGRAKDESGIATLTVNGKTVAAEDDGLFVTSLVLKGGQNTITIVATDKQGNSATRDFIVNGKLADTDTDEAVIIPVSNGSLPKYHAIVIAAEDYVDTGIDDLKNPVKDASELKSILESSYSFESKNIQTLYNKSRDEIMQAIIQTSNALTENDNLLIFYAGHGIAEKDRFGDVDGYWIPSNAKVGLTSTYISADDIKKALKRSVAKHILVIADACFSGSFTRGLAKDASVGIQKQYNVPSRKVMASGNLEPVPDNSKFIFYLKKNLKENSEKYLTAKKLFDSFYEAILNNSDTSPQYAAIKNIGDEGGEFVFIKK